jgi:transcriptional regulator GlxA family with amidase domain
MNESILVEVFGSLGRLRALRALFAEPERGFGQRELAAEGVTFKKIINDTRITIARDYAGREDANGVRLASVLGFSSPSVASRFMHKNFGDALDNPMPAPRRRVRTPKAQRVSRKTASSD